MPYSPESSTNLLSRKFTRREFFQKAVPIISGVAAAGLLGREIGRWIEDQQETRDPYRGLPLDGYLAGYVSVDLKSATLRTAPRLSPQYLRSNNPEGYVIGNIPPGFVEVVQISDNSSSRKAILGDLVEVNRISVVEDRYDPVTDRKSILITPIMIQNPGIVKGDNPDGSNNQGGIWIVINTMTRIPDNVSSWEYTTLRTHFYLSVSRQTSKYIKLLDENGNVVQDFMHKVVPLTTLQDGRHIIAGSSQLARYLGRVTLRNS